MVQHPHAQNQDGENISRVSRRWLRGRAMGLLVLGLVVLASPALIGSASAQSGPQGIALASPWMTYFCLTPAQCVAGDFNGDRRADVAVFNHSYSQPIGKTGDVWVALSNGTSFDYPQLWKESFCVSNTRVCKVGDFNGDQRDDIIEFGRGSGGNVYVALSEGLGFGDSTLWTSGFCVNDEVCDVGDYDGDGSDDISTFTRSLYSDTGLVWVGLSNRVNGFAAGEIWTSFFCIQREMCGSGDFNGDGKDDIIAFRKVDNPAGPVYVALSDGTKFNKGDSTPWNDFFCPGLEVCGVADFNGDGKDDIITYLRSSYAGSADPKIGYVYVALSDGTRFNKGDNEPWATFFCIGNGQGDTGEICGSGNYIDAIGTSPSYYTYSQVSRTGDYNKDGRDDVVVFLRSTELSSKPGYIYVKLAYGNQFVDALPVLPPRVRLPLMLR